jgi:thymidylate synthase (FAD)
MLSEGIAKESARFILPLATPTRLYMNGTLRSWIHYLQLRCDPGTQLEHREIAEAIKRIFCKQFPIIGEAVFCE